jgi:hypothetical protein
VLVLVLVLVLARGRRCGHLRARSAACNERAIIE